MKKDEWGEWPNFSYAEMSCKETGANDMKVSFMDSLQRLRHVCGFPFVVSSGYRSLLHSVEKAKKSPGAHTLGKAVDILVSGEEAFRLLSLAMSSDSGFFGVGIAQRGPHDKRFIHLDGLIDEEGFPRPFVWSY